MDSLSFFLSFMLTSGPRLAWFEEGVEKEPFRQERLFSFNSFIYAMLFPNHF